MMQWRSRQCRHARELTSAGRVVNSVGHNPLGGLMVIFMLLLVVLQVICRR